MDLELYVGEYRHNRDAKGRLTVPSKWRFPGDEMQMFLAIPAPSGCITVYPPRAVAELKARLEKLRMSDIAGQRAVMQILGKADNFRFDKAGRIKISDRLYEYAGIDREVLCVGTLNVFHFWEPERYNQHMSVGESEVGNSAEVLGSLGL